MIIKKANAYDATNIAKVHFDEWSSFYKNYVSHEFIEKFSFENRKKFWMRYISDGGIIYVVEEKTGDIVGFAVPKLISKSYEENEGEIIAHYVGKHYQKKGYGKLLLVSCAKFFAKNKVKNMYVWLHQENPAIMFYESQGAQESDFKIDRVEARNIVKLKYSFHDIEAYVENNESVFEGVLKEF